ncbi:hypothetical protein [Haloferula sp. BvORR071]|uniref:hypothetical protein n=1 Tax=Haloferula sp. BvORR071 TaxID=1396141 RepID=UPI0005554487|nr:hypothetical protein [Haloferula sp. BvORR071]
MPNRRDKEPPPKKKRPPAFYWWTLANVLALCLAVLTWLLCLHIFGHPEIPRNYEILRKLHRTVPPEDLSELNAPAAESADPRAFFRRYAALKDEDLKLLNAALMRNYLTNLKEKNLIQYAEGDYRIDKVRLLGPDDVFQPGFAVRAQAMVRPDELTDAAPWPVMIEYLFPTNETSASSWMSPGDMLKVSKFPNCAMLLHVSRSEGEDTPVICLTVVPIAFGEFQVGKNRAFTLEVPKELNPGGFLPVFPENPDKPAASN